MPIDTLRILLERPELADELLIELDRIAREYDHFEYGLPSLPPERAQLREALHRWLAKLDREVSAA
jgi:hypothetical protein